MSQFHLSVGPVQSFVAQAKRTKDLWAGSFLLSWVSSIAIKLLECQSSSNTVQFPVPDKSFMAAIVGGTTEQLPKQGGIPNRFRSITAQVDTGFDPQKLVSDMNFVWKSLCDHVYRNDIEPAMTEFDAEQIALTKSIWDRQVNGFWEVFWVVSTDSTIGLDQRKSWRSHAMTNEPGFKCSMMSGLQELSGSTTSNVRRDFWKAVRAKVGVADLEDGEELCSIAFIKRRFAKHFSSFKVDVDQQTFVGWSFFDDGYDPNHVPSTTYLAAAPFITNLLTNLSDNPAASNKWEQCLELAQGVSFLARPYHSVVSQIISADAGNPRHALFDAKILHDEALVAACKGDRKQLHQIEQLISCRDQAISEIGGMTNASTQYAILLMDGDSLGSHIADIAKQQPISNALNQFTKAVSEIIESHNGFLCYAGGDDVLALMPVDKVMAAANELRLSYSSSIDEHASSVGVTSTLSGAIVYAHMTTPLMSVVVKAHQLLDGVAKEATGRNAIAFAVDYRGMKYAEYAAPWDKAVSDEGYHLERLASFFNGESNSNFSMSYLTRLHDFFESIKGESFDDTSIRSLAKSLAFTGSEANSEVSDEFLSLLLEVSTSYETDVTGDEVQINSRGYSEKGLTVMRYMLGVAND